MDSGVTLFLGGPIRVSWSMHRLPKRTRRGLRGGLVRGGVIADRVPQHDQVFARVVEVEDVRGICLPCWHLSGLCRR